MALGTPLTWVYAACGIPLRRSQVCMCPTTFMIRNLVMRRFGGGFGSPFDSVAGLTPGVGFADWYVRIRYLDDVAASRVSVLFVGASDQWGSKWHDVGSSPR